MENLYKVGGSNQRLRQAKNYLRHRLVDDAITEFIDLQKKSAKNLQNHLHQHRLELLIIISALSRARYLY